MTNLLLLGFAPGIESQVRNIDDVTVLAVRPVQIPATISELMHDLDGEQLPEITIIASEGDPRDCLPLVRLLAKAGRTQVIVVADGDPAIMLDAFRAGASDVLPSEATVDELAAAISRTSMEATATAVHTTSISEEEEAAAESAERGEVIVVVSPSGGVGKTLFATNLAVGIAGTRPGSTVLVDADLHFGNVASHLRLFANTSIADLTTFTDTVALKSHLTKHDESGLFVAPASGNPLDDVSVTPAAVGGLITRLAHMFPTVVVDTSAGFGGANVEILSRADQVLLVTNLTVPAIQSMQGYLELFSQLPNAPHSQLLVNMCEPNVGLNLADVEANLKRKADMTVRYSRDLILSVNRGTPAMLAGRRDPLRRSLSQLVGMFHTHADARRGTGAKKAA